MTPPRLGVALVLVGVLAALATSPASGTFAGDNGRIAFTMRTETGVNDVYTMNPDGTGVTQVTSHPARDLNPRWSPDGARIAFASDRDGDLDIWVADADGRNLVQVTDSESGIGEFTPAWTADGRHIVFQRFFALEIAEIWIANADGTGGEQKLADGYIPGTSPHGQKVVYGGRADNQLYVLNLGDGTTTRITDGPAFRGEANWSPRGNRLVVSQGPDVTAFFDVHVMHANGGQAVQVTDTDPPLQDSAPVWSPDGERIAFSQCDFTGGVQGNCTIWTARPDGTDRTEIQIEGALFRVGGRIDWQAAPKR